jgi:hypothetical protein
MVSFDIEIKAASDALASALEVITNDITDADILAAFTTELKADNIPIPKGLYVGPATMCIAGGDFSATAIASSTNTCAQVSLSLLLEANRTSWTDVSCTDLSPSARVFKNSAGNLENMFSTLASIGTSCCGSAEKTRSLAARWTSKEDNTCEADYKDDVVVKFANTVTGFSKATFVDAVQDAYKRAIASKAGVLLEVVSIWRIMDGDKPASSRRRLEDGHDGHDHDMVSFDIEIKAASDALASALEVITNDITDADILAAFTTELKAVNIPIPEGLDVGKADAIITKASEKSNIGAIIGGIIGGLIAVGLVYWYFCVHKKKAAPAPKNVQQAEMTPVSSGALTTKGAAAAPVSTV